MIVRGMGVGQTYQPLFKIRWVDISGKAKNCGYGEVPKLPTNFKLIVAFDQSTKQTGMAVSTEDGRRFMMVDFENNGGNIPMIEYERMLEISLTNMFKGREVVRVILEKPFKGNGKYSYSVLERLRGFMETLMYRIPEWRNASLEGIYPQSWRKSYLADKSRYKGRFSKDKVKDAAREETGIRYPWSKGYIYSGPAPDSCDAMGILDGFYEANYTDGMRVVNSTMNVNFNHNFSWNVEVFKTEDIKGSLRNTNKYNEIIFVRGYTVVRYNEDMLIEDNVRRITSNTNQVVVMPVLDVQENMVLRWETGIELKPGEVYCVVCWRDNTSTKLGEVEPLWSEQSYWNPKIG